MKWLCLTLVRAYQIWLGPFLGGSCRFYPSCSRYAFEAIERHGAARGFRLSVSRLLRCHPFSFGGVDLVPDPASPIHKKACGEEFVP
jgi:putative membrane protein insertion efficiency factor